MKYNVNDRPDLDDFIQYPVKFTFRERIEQFLAWLFPDGGW